jgi:hypothetical protein
MHRLARWLVALALGVGVAGHARADEDPKKVARQHYEAGADAMRKGDYDGARKEFEAAYASSPNYRVLYDIAEAELGLGLPEQALAAFQRFLTDGGDQVPPKQREQVTQQMAQLELGFAWLEVATEPVGAEVTLDGAPLGTTPLASPVRTRAGVHVVGASRTGAAPVRRVVTLKGGQRERVALAVPDAPPERSPLSAASAAPATPAAREVAPAPHQAGFPVGYVLIGAGIAAAGVTGTEYAWNRGRVDRFHANESALRNDTSPDRRERVIRNNELADSIGRASAVTVGFGIAAGALVAGGVVWLLVDPGGKAPNERDSARLERWVPALTVSRDALAASWRGAW